MKRLILSMLLLTACSKTEYYAFQLEAAQPAPPPTPVSLGCYLDTSARVLPDFLLTSGTTVENCMLFAKEAGYKYAGVEYGVQCFAGNTKPTVTAVNCNMVCTANTTEICGGSWAMNVYEIQ